MPSCSALLRSTSSNPHLQPDLFGMVGDDSQRIGHFLGVERRQLDRRICHRIAAHNAAQHHVAAASIHAHRIAAHCLRHGHAEPFHVYIGGDHIWLRLARLVQQGQGTDPRRERGDHNLIGAQSNRVENRGVRHINPAETGLRIQEQRVAYHHMQRLALIDHAVHSARNRRWLCRRGSRGRILCAWQCAQRGNRRRWCSHRRRRNSHHLRHTGNWQDYCQQNGGRRIRRGKWLGRPASDMEYTRFHWKLSVLGVVPRIVSTE